VITGVILGWIGYRNQRMASLYDELPHDRRTHSQG
jgi:hypothetical protein